MATSADSNASEDHAMAGQCQPGFTEYNLGTSAEKAPLRFYGHTLAQAEREQGSVTRCYVLYGTSDDQFVGEATVLDNRQSTGFSEHRLFETLDRACAWFGDEILKAELLRQLAVPKSESVK